MALEYCDWIHLLEEGRLVESGPPGDVLVPEILEPIYNVRVVRTEHHLHFERLEKRKTSTIEIRPASARTTDPGWLQQRRNRGERRQDPADAAGFR